MFARPFRSARILGSHSGKSIFPNTVPGIGAGAILVFILAIGYYITPELVGGTEGTFISEPNRLSYLRFFELGARCLAWRDSPRSRDRALPALRQDRRHR